MNQTTETRYFLAQDNSTHWYIVRADKRVDWDAWCAIPEDDEASWIPPEFSRPIGGSPSAITFARPAENLRVK